MDGPTDLVHLPAQVAESSAAPQQDVKASRSPARAQLALAIADLARAGAKLAAAQEPASRLGAVIADAARLEDEIAALRAGDEARLSAWLVAGGGPRPEPARGTIAAEKQRTVLAADADAAQAALPAAERSFQHCAERVREAQRRRDTALCGGQSMRRATLPSATARR